MKIYDISMEIFYDMQVYKNKDENRPIINSYSTYENSTMFQSNIKLDLHNGTHMDRPLHMIKDGKNMNSYDVSRMITDCKVFDFTNVEDMVTAEDLKQKEINENEFIILKTKNSFEDDFNFNFISLSSCGAKYLAEKKINGVGIDALGIERAQPDRSTHISLLEKDIIILEGLRLKEVKEDEYILIALPLKIKDVEGSPVRAILLEKNFKI